MTDFVKPQKQEGITLFDVASGKLDHLNLKQVVSGEVIHVMLKMLIFFYVTTFFVLYS